MRLFFGIARLSSGTNLVQGDDAARREDRSRVNRTEVRSDPWFMFHRWRANLRILGIEEIKSTPYVPISHPFIERLIGTIRREYFDHVMFWTATDLERKLDAFKDYYNGHRFRKLPDHRSGPCRPGGHGR